jgi:hypothetical protein
MKIHAEKRIFARANVKNPFNHYVNLMRLGRITERDVLLLEQLHRFRFLSLSQLKDLFFPSLRVARRRMRMLYELQLVDRFRPWCGVGSEEYIYCIDQVGVFFLAAKLGKPAEDLGWRKRDNEVRLAYVTHFLKKAEVYLKLRRHVRIEKINTEPELRHQHYNFRPDIFIQFTKRGELCRWYVEVDLGTEWRNKIEKKVEDYEKYYMVNRDCAVVVFVADSEMRLEQIKKWVEEKRKVKQIQYEYKTYESLTK